MKSSVQRRLQQLELRAREVKVNVPVPGFAVKRLMDRIEQIRSRLPPGTPEVPNPEFVIAQLRERVRVLCGRPNA